MGKIKLNSDLAIYTNNAKSAVSNSGTRKLIISTHGGWGPTDGTFSPRSEFNVLVSFYASENYSVTGDLTDALSGQIETIDSPMVRIKNYELARFEDDPKNEELSKHLNDRFDVMKVRTKWFGSRSVHLRAVLETLQGKGYRYGEICCLFCRYTGGETEMDARKRTSGERERLDHLSKTHALVEELKSRQHR